MSKSVGVWDGSIPGRRKGMRKSAGILKEHDIFKVWHRDPSDYRVKTGELSKEKWGGRRFNEGGHRHIKASQLNHEGN